MHIGLFNVNGGVMSQPGPARRVAQLAESLGYESLWVGEHMVLPSPRVAPSPMEATDPILDPVVALSFLAAVTTQVKLGTGILLLPQRPPVALAKELASLDVLSQGRLIVGVGIGYLGPEMAAVGVPMERRDERAADYLGAMRALWTMDAPEFHGEFADFAGVDAHPRPTNPAGPPVVMGGHSDAAYRRAATQADGWYGFRVDPAAVRHGVERLAVMADRHGSRVPIEQFEISATPTEALTPELVAQYAEAGCHRLIVMGSPRADLARLEAFVAASAPGALGL